MIITIIFGEENDLIVLVEYKFGNVLGSVLNAMNQWNKIIKWSRDALLSHYPVYNLFSLTKIYFEIGKNDCSAMKVKS